LYRTNKVLKEFDQKRPKGIRKNKFKRKRSNTLVKNYNRFLVEPEVKEI
jgi:hypothetical protein